MNSRPNRFESRHMMRVKALPPCGLCGAAPPSDAHHIRQHRHYITIPLCRRCHDQVPNGPMWKVMKRDELDVLNETVGKLR